MVQIESILSQGWSKYNFISSRDGPNRILYYPGMVQIEFYIINGWSK
jgi:hypothetical protein